MKKIKCTIAYDGTNYCGYQIQPHNRTVQSEVEKALKRLHKEPVKSHASGRTDAGVHAKGQVIHFETALTIPLANWPQALNTNLPDDIVVQKAEEVGLDFHARYNAVQKEYRYYVHIGRLPNVFERNYVYHFPRQLDVKAIQEAAGHFVGTHDFTSFCAAKSKVENKVRTIHVLECIQTEDKLMFRFVGNGFLYNMVRIIVSTLLKVGEQKIAPDDIPELIQQRNRKRTGSTAPGHGLFLWKVTYKV